MTTSTETAAPEGIRWGRVIVGGLIIYLLMSLIGALLYLLDRLDDAARWEVAIMAVSALLGGAWTARGVSRPVLHGALAGVASIGFIAAIAVIVMLADPEQFAAEAVLAVATLVKLAVNVIAAAAGAWLVGRKRAN